MRNKAIEPGERYSRLTVIELHDTIQSPGGNKAKRYRCRCDCGNECIVRGSNLRNGNTKSCGCAKNEWLSTLDKNRKLKDISGKTFGSLTALREYSRMAGNKPVWVCRCTCGIEIAVPYNALVGGSVTDCGVCGGKSLEE